MKKQSERTTLRIGFANDSTTSRSSRKKTTIECSYNMLTSIANSSLTKDTIVVGYDNKVIEPVIMKNYFEYTF
jgi:hypothetical protein